MEGRKKIRIKDIATKAKVSAGTVDRVLHNRGEVNAATRKKVMDIVNELGYQPNLLAKTLATKTTFTIATILPNVSDNNPYWEIPLLGINKAASELNDYNTEISNYTFNATQEETFQEITKQIIAHPPSGVVFNPVFKTASINFTQQLDALEIPYVFIDTDLKQSNKLAYFGQNAQQSGQVAAKIMSKTLQLNSTILIAKLANNKVINHHIKTREEGFKQYFTNNKQFNFKLISHEIDLLQTNEPHQTLQTILQSNPNISGIFVPSSRVFLVAEFLQLNWLKPQVILGYDLIQKNINYLNNGYIDYLIHQSPEAQGYNSIHAIFNHIVSHKTISRINHSSIQIIIKENCEYI